MSRTSTLIALVIGAALCSGTALAQHASKGKAKGHDDAPGQQVAIEPNGQLRQPTAEEAKELSDGLQQRLSQPTEGLPVTQHDNGAVSVDLMETHESASLAKIEDGKVKTKCVTTVAEAREFLAPAKKQRAKTKKSKRSAATSASAGLETK